MNDCSVMLNRVKQSAYFFKPEAWNLAILQQHEITRHLPRENLVAKLGRAVFKIPDAHNRSNTSANLTKYLVGIPFDCYCNV